MFHSKCFCTTECSTGVIATFMGQEPVQREDQEPFSFFFPFLSLILLLVYLICCLHSFQELFAQHAMAGTCF